MNKEILEAYKKQNPVKYAQKFGGVELPEQTIGEDTVTEQTETVVETSSKPKKKK